MIRTKAKSGICRRAKIDVKKPGVDLGQNRGAVKRAIDCQHHFIPAGGWRIAEVRANGRSDETIGIAYIGYVKSEADRVSRTTC